MADPIFTTRAELAAWRQTTVQKACELPLINFSAPRSYYLEACREAHELLADVERITTAHAHLKDTNDDRG